VTLLGLSGAPPSHSALPTVIRRPGNCAPPFFPSLRLKKHSFISAYGELCPPRYGSKNKTAQKHSLVWRKFEITLNLNLYPTYYVTPKQPQIQNLQTCFKIEITSLIGSWWGFSQLSRSIGWRVRFGSVGGKSLSQNFGERGNQRVNFKVITISSNEKLSKDV